MIRQDIQKFYDTSATRDFARDFLFRVTDINLAGVGGLSESDLVYVKAAALPGRSITNVPVPYMGLNFNVPGNATYPGSEGYALKFYLDSESTLRNYFEAASRFLFDDASSTGNYGTPGVNTYIVLSQLRKDFTPVQDGTYKLVGASLRNITDIGYQIAGGTGTTLEVDATIAYHYYEKL